jgi:flagellar export protein FliJ
MKKFKFSLQTVFEYIQTVEKTQKADLNNALALLRQLYDREQELEEAYERNKASLEEALRSQTGLPEALGKHDAYFRYLREEKNALKKKIEGAEQQRDQCREKLIATKKQLKTYAKLRDEQYENYLRETRNEEEKDIGDLVSFQETTDMPAGQG